MNQVNSDRLNGEIFIDFKEFFWRIAEQWKAIVVVALILMLLFSGVNYLMAASDKDTEETEYGSQEEVLESLSVNDREMVLSVLKEKAARDKLQEYIKNSPYMNLDPYRVNTINMSWLVTSDENINRQLVAAYINELGSYKLADAVNQSWGSPYNSENIRELLSVKSNIPVNTEAELNGNLITITLYVPGDNDGKKAIEAINSIVQTVNSKLSNAIGTHEIQALTSEQTVTSSLSLAEDQFNHYNRFYNISNQLNNFNKILTDGQNAAYAAISQINEAVDDADDQQTIIPGSDEKYSLFNIKNMLIGFILGILLYVCLYFAYYVLLGKVMCPLELEASYGIRNIGEWYSDKKTGLEGVLTDNNIYKRHHKGHLNIQSEVNRICESIYYVFTLNDRRKLLLISNEGIKESTEGFLSLLTDRLIDYGMDVTKAKIDYSNGKYLSESIVAGSDEVILLVEKGKTRRKDIIEVLDKCKYCNKPSIRTVYVD